MRQTTHGLEKVEGSLGGLEFEPNGLNDDRRLSMLGQPFLAIDPPNAQERDDAVRVGRLAGGGFLVETAIADAAQIEPDSRLVLNALVKRATKYDEDGRIEGSEILPPDIADKLDLNLGQRRSILISQAYDKELKPQGKLVVAPAIVQVKHTSYRDFGENVREQNEKGIRTALPMFNEEFRKALRKPDLPHVPEAEFYRPAKYGRRLVQTCMVLANIAVADWAKRRNIPILYREFSGTEETSRLMDETRTDKLVYANYTVEPQPHKRIARFARRPNAPYTHFTSPIRRAADLINHLQISAFLAGQELPFNRNDLAYMAAWLSAIKR